MEAIVIVDEGSGDSLFRQIETIPGEWIGQLTFSTAPI